MSHPIRTAVFRHLTPPRIFILSFALLILIGAVLLRMPFAASGQHLSFVDALFSSASAVCVTGLAVIDIGKDLSLTGQITTLILFQVGGLGIITFSVVLFGLMGRGVSFKGREIVQSTFLHTPRRDFLVIAKAVLILTVYDGLERATHGPAGKPVRRLRAHTPVRFVPLILIPAEAGDGCIGGSLC